MNIVEVLEQALDQENDWYFLQYQCQVFHQVFALKNMHWRFELESTLGRIVPENTRILT